MTEPVELVIFDCDGVLVDSERLYVRVDRISIEEMGWSMTEDEVQERFQGRPHAYMMSEVDRVVGRATRDEYEPRMHARRREAFERELEPVPGIVEALDAIDLPTCVASSSTHELIEFVLELTDLRERFDGRIYSAQDVGVGKPAPDLFLHAASSMGMDPARCLVVEDSSAGVAAARAAGMRSLGYHGGITSAAALEGDRTVLFDDMNRLPGLIASMSGSPQSAKTDR